MKKKFLRKVSIVLTGLLFLFSSIGNLVAAGNLVVLDPGDASTSLNEKGEYGGGVFSRTLIDNKGQLLFEVKFNNAKNTEAVFLVDNKTNTTFTTSALTSLNTLVSTLVTNTKYFKASVAGFNPTAGANTQSMPSNSVSYTSDTSVISNQINNISSNLGNGVGDLVTAINYANSSFSSKIENKVIVLVMASFDKTSATAIRNAMTTLQNSGVRFVTVLSDFKSDGGNTAAITQVFGAGPVYDFGPFYNIVSADLATTISNNTKIGIMGTLPTAKTIVRVQETLTAAALANFDFSFTGTPKGNVSSIDPATRTYTWEIGNVEVNEIVTLRYKLTLKNVIDKNSLNNKTQILEGTHVTGNSNTFGAFNIDWEGTDDLCMPDVRITEGVPNPDNPKTGIIQDFTPYFVVALVAIAAFLYFRNKESIKL